MLDLFVDYTTPPCPVCGEQDTIQVDPDRLHEWRTGTLAQLAFPEATDSYREQIVTGTHPKCWRLLFDTEEPF